MMSNRRVFLKSLGMGAGAFMLSSGLMPRRVRAAGADRRFVFAYFSGGWDTLLGLDPRDPSVFTEARIGATRIELGWDRIPATYPRTIIQPAGSNIDFGPVMGSIAPHFDVMCVVRGLSMDTVTHEVGRRYFITGMTPRGTRAAGSAMATRVAAQQGDLRPIPSLVSRVETYNEGDPVFASGMSVASPTDLVSALQDGPQAPRGALRSRLDAYRAQATSCDPSGLDKRGFLGLLRANQDKARDLVGSGISSHFAFTNAADPEIAALRTRYGITNATLTASGAQAALAFQALKHGVAQCVTVELASGLDTHDAGWSDDQPDRQAAGWTALAQLVADLKAEPDGAGGTLIDRTTLVVFSEFGRTALLNNRDGRDHSLCSSCLLIGAGVPHNRVVGASSDLGMNPLAIDPTTGGAVTSGGVVMNPNNVLASVLESAGYDTDRLRTDGLPCLMA